MHFTLIFCEHFSSSAAFAFTHGNKTKGFVSGPGNKKGQSMNTLLFVFTVPWKADGKKKVSRI